MSEYLALAAVITALYLSECVLWARHGAVIVTAPFLFRPRLRLLSRAFGNTKGGFAFLNPLPPFGRVYVVEPWPFSLGTAGVVAARSFSLAHEPRPAQRPLRLAWGQIERVSAVDKGVWVNGALFAACSSARHAQHAASVLQQLIATNDPDEREQRLSRAIAAHVDPNAVRALVRRHVRWSVPVVLAAVGTFVALFGFVPAIVADSGLEHWPVLVGAVYAFVLLAMVALVVAHRALQPGERGDRWLQTLLLLPAPTMALRANDKLGRWLLAGSHPVAVALGLLSDAERDAVVGRALRDLAQPRRPALPTDDEEALAIDADFRARMLAAAKAQASMAGVDVNAVSQAPALAAGQVTFCPRCHASFRQLGPCSDCAIPTEMAAPG